MPITLTAAPLTRAAFAPFGDVIEKAGAQSFATNQGTAMRYHDLARLELTAAGGRGLVSIFQATQPATLPVRLRLLERHPISSQAFIPLAPVPYLVVVAPGTDAPDLSAIRAFAPAPGQGINFAPATWHHPLIALAPANFLVIDRTGPGPGFDQDYEEVLLGEVEMVVAMA